ncbi:MAG: type III-B CRISPR module RAMP protein Cmr6 [Deltaproteobacteria bacterium]|nr:type III-B CRISPR module RAMP protein Cmr6 [Deltaproteobacteria bacterium]
MAQYAAPQYMNSHLTSYDALSPGHRFGLFFKCWKSDWNRDDEGKKDGLKQVLELKTPVKDLIKALRLRQAAQAQTFSKGLYQISALSESPFMTGIGMEHPVENGFAFLNPYGIPYLPGSGVKGVLRRVAEELALDNSLGDGWDLGAVWCLFGFEAGSLYLTGKPRPPLDEVAPKWWEKYNNNIDKLATSPWLAAWMEGLLRGQDRDIYLSRPKEFLQALAKEKKVREKISFRGALSFWDVLPEPGGGQLGMDILTPHYIDYYQGSSPPNDSGKPVPNPFLVMPPGSRFTFYVQCDSNRLPEALAKSWQDLLTKAFEHAFDWLGFGAKTAVGYGQMVYEKRNMPEENQASAGGHVAAAKPTFAAETLIWEKAHLSYAPGNQQLTATSGNCKAQIKLIDKKFIPESLHKVLFDKKKSTLAKVTVIKEGNMYTIEKIEMP